MVAAGPQMSSDPLALQKDLNGARCQPRLDLAPGKTVGDAVEMALELDMVIDADPTDAPFGKAIGLRRQRLEVGPIELFEQRPTGSSGEYWTMGASLIQQCRVSDEGLRVVKLFRRGR